MSLGTCSQTGIVNPATLCNGIAVWSGQATYVANDVAVYNGQKFKAKWWTQNENPSTSTSGVWELVSTCVYSTINATATFTAFATVVGTPSGVQTFSLSGSGLSSQVIITAPSHFEISQNGTNYASVINLSISNGSLANTTISVRYNPFSIGTHTGDLTIETLGLTTQKFTLTGTAQATWIAKDATTLYSNLAFTKVGIGTNTPTEKLTVAGNIAQLGSDFKLGQADSRNQGTKLENRALVHAFSDDLIINYDGDFEGGVTIQGVGLKVAKIATGEVCVNPNLAWCDYVFDKDYHLRPLSEVEKYIRLNKHLPEIPAAKEVENNGIALSEMVTLQMKKIEELTLYVIQQQKEIEALKTQIEKR